MKIVLFANTDWYMYNFNLSLARTLVERGDEVLLVTPPGPYGEKLREMGFRWVPAPMQRRSLNIFREIGLVIWLTRLLVREQADLIHSFTIKCAVYGSLAARWARVPARVNAITGLGYVFTNTSLKARILKPIVMVLMRLAFGGNEARLIVLNRDDFAFFSRSKFFNSVIPRLIPGAGIDCNRFAPQKMLEKGKLFRVLLASRLLWDKGISEYVEAATLLLGQGRRIEFLLAGAPDPGNPAAVPERLVHRWSEKGLIRWLGHVEDMPTLYNSVDVVVLPSYREGLPTGLTEAGACQLALVATDVPGCRDVVTSNVDGLLVPARNFRALADAIARLQDDPALCARLGTAARARALEEFADAMVLRLTLGVYQEAYGHLVGVDIFHSNGPNDESEGVKHHKIVLFANTDWYLYNFRLTLIKSLVDKGSTVLLVTPPGPYGEKLREMGFRWVPAPMQRRSLNIFREIGLVIWLTRLLVREQADLIHSFTIKCAVYGSLAARWARVPARVNAITGLGYVFTNTSLKARILRFFTSRVMSVAIRSKGCRLILQNRDDVAIILEEGIASERQIRLIPSSGVDLSRFHPPSQLSPSHVRMRVLLPSRLLWDKGLAEFAEASRLLHNDGHIIDFLLAGDFDAGNPASVPEAVVNGWVEENLLQWLGHVADMPELFRSVDVVVLPSYREGLPKGLIEAAACARPIITTDVPGCRDVVTNGVDGLLVPVGDATALAEAIARLLNDAKLCARLGAAARSKSLSLYDDRIIIKRTVAVYSELLNVENIR